MFKLRLIISKSELSNLQTRQKAKKKLKNTNPLELHFPYMTILKAPKNKYCLSFRHMPQICCVIYRSSSYNLLVWQKSKIDLFKYANSKNNLTKK